jgi:hypothetical protein
VLGEKIEADVIKSREVLVEKQPGKSCDLLIGD